VHVDKKTDKAIYNKMVKGVSYLPNVFFLKRHTCYWGGFGHVLATIEGLEKALHMDIEFDYVFLLTGQDYPIKSNDYIEQFLLKNKGKEFIHYRPLPRELIETWNFWLNGRRFHIPSGPRQFKSKIKSLIWKILRHFVPKRSFPTNLDPFAGSSYWCITKGCAEYIHDFVEQNKWFDRYFKHVCMPDEIFFQTIVLNSPFKERVINNDLRCIDWACSGRGHPKIWREQDIGILSQSNSLIARKFDTTIDAEILNLIDSKLLSNRHSSDGTCC
jgi:hypothetical protein